MISLENISLRPFGGEGGAGRTNAFAAFAGGAGVALKKASDASTTASEKKAASDAKQPQAARQNRDDVKTYTSEFLMKFAERYTRLPTELQFGNIEIIIDEKDQNQRDAQRKLLQKVAGGIDGDWHKDQSGGNKKGGKKGDKGGIKGDKADDAHKIQRAADLGRTAWAAGADDGSKQVLRKMKGILNKLTPEKFERLLGQLIPLITSHEVLQGTITMVFENAVAQPTFVAMYANLCAELDSILPEFAGKDGKPESFRKMLANTCQEEYESTEFEMKNAEKASGGVEKKEEVQARAKNRLLGNVRLIAELFKKALVNDRIMLLILSDLLGPAENNPSEDWLEAACELVAVAGEKLEASPRSKARLDAIFEHFKRLSSTTTYAPRIRFVVKDVVDLRSQNWVARRETYTAKKLDEIRTEAQAELGIVDVEIPGLTPLGIGIDVVSTQKNDDVELFPKFKGNLASNKAAEDGEKFTSLLGQFVPISETADEERCVCALISISLSLCRLGERKNPAGDSKARHPYRILLSERPRTWGAPVYILRRETPCIKSDIVAHTWRRCK